MKETDLEKKKEQKMFTFKTGQNQLKRIRKFNISKILICSDNIDVFSLQSKQNSEMIT